MNTKEVTQVRCSFCTGSGWIISHGKDWEKRPPMRRCGHCGGTGKLPGGANVEIKILEHALRLIESDEMPQQPAENAEEWVKRVLAKATEATGNMEG